jgi:hypothetical protein
MIEIVSIVGIWLICTIAAERSAEAITTSVLFSPMRQFFAKTALLDQQEAAESSLKRKIVAGFCRWLSELISCGWCTSCWTSFFFSFFLPGRYFCLNASGNILVKTIALWGLANFYHSVFRLLHNGRVAAIDINLRIIDSEPTEYNYGGTNGELGEGISQEDTIGVEPPEV